MSGDVVRPHFSSFRRRFSARQHVVGSFIKTPTTHATEIFGALGYDFVVIDEEHAPIDRAMTDVMLLAARASNLAGIVRVSSDDPAKILSCLDCGATGVLVPHVATVEKARAVAAARDTAADGAAIPARPAPAPMAARRCGPSSMNRMHRSARSR